MLQSLNEHILAITRQLDNELFMSADRRARLLRVLDGLLQQRERYNETIQGMEEKEMDKDK